MLGLGLFEKVMWVLTGVLVVGVIGLVVVNSVVGLSFAESELKDDEADALFRMANQHWEGVGAPDGVTGISAFTFAPGVTAEHASKVAAAGARAGDGTAGSAGGSAPGAAGSGADPRSVRTPQPRISRPGSQGWTQDERTRTPEAPPVFLPSQLVDKFRHFQDAKDALMSARSQEVVMPDGRTGVRMIDIPADHPLRKYIGLQDDDIVIAVNGYAVSKANGMQVYERLKSKSSFRAEIERNGTRFIARYEVN